MNNPVPLPFTEDDATEMLQSNYWAKFSEARELLMEAASRGYAHAAAQSAADNAALRERLLAQDAHEASLAEAQAYLMARVKVLQAVVESAAAADVFKDSPGAMAKLAQYARAALGDKT